MKILDISPSALRLLWIALAFSVLSTFVIGCGTDTSGTGDDVPGTGGAAMTGTGGAAMTGTGGAAMTGTGGAAMTGTGGASTGTGGASIGTGGAPALVAVGGACDSGVQCVSGLCQIGTCRSPSAGTGGSSGTGGAPAKLADGAKADVSSSCASGFACFAMGLDTFCEPVGATVQATRAVCTTGGGLTMVPGALPSTGIDVPCRVASDCPTTLIVSDSPLPVLKCSGYVPGTGRDMKTGETIGFCSR